MRAFSVVAASCLALVACSRAQSSSTSTPATATPTTNAAAAPTSTAAATAPAASASGAAAGAAQTDTIPTSAGPLTITPIHHATFVMGFGGKTIVMDPWSEGMHGDAPKADYVFVTDIHPDHLDPKEIDAVAKPGATLVGPPAVDAQKKMTVVMKNGDTHDFGAFKVEAVPMYNEKRGPQPGKVFHDKGRGDGYVFTFGDTRVYVSGDTECTPEMRALKNITVAFVCMNLPYTMTPDEAAQCVTAFKPKIVYPFHYRGQDLAGFKSTVEKAGIDVRLRDWYGPNGQ